MCINYRVLVRNLIGMPLQKLELSYVHTSDGDISLLSGLPLTYLMLSGMEFVSIAELASLQLLNLTTLTIFDCNIDSTTFRELEPLLPISTYRATLSDLIAEEDGQSNGSNEDDDQDNTDEDQSDVDGWL